MSSNNTRNIAIGLAFVLVLLIGIAVAWAINDGEHMNLLDAEAQRDALRMHNTNNTAAMPVFAPNRDLYTGTEEIELQEFTSVQSPLSLKEYYVTNQMNSPEHYRHYSGNANQSLCGNIRNFGNARDFGNTRDFRNTRSSRNKPPF